MTNSAPSTEPPKTTSFGFKTVTPEEKVSRVKHVFASVASKYDLMNDLMSVGIHRLWKHDTIARLNPQPGECLLDVAGGTGDLAKAFLQRAGRLAKRRAANPNAATKASAVICDINQAMLEAGKARSDMAAYSQQLNWVCGDAMALPFEDRRFDALTIAFGIRNVADRAIALTEFRRVLKPGGRIAILEFSHMTAPILQKAYDAYSFAIIPPIGAVIAGDRDSYQYLVESIRKFPKQNAFKAEIERAGFANLSVTNFSGGIAALHFGWAV